MQPSARPARGVEWLPTMPWNRCPPSRGISAHLPWNTQSPRLLQRRCIDPSAAFVLFVQKFGGAAHEFRIAAAERIAEQAFHFELFIQGAANDLENRLLGGLN